MCCVPLLLMQATAEKILGAKGAYSYEKNITLAVALKLQATLQQAMPDVKIVMTRTTDIFDPPPVKAVKQIRQKETCSSVFTAIQRLL
jgi:N-acetylmuramoyl-L-alanine amidase